MVELDARYVEASSFRFLTSSVECAFLFFISNLTT